MEEKVAVDDRYRSAKREWGKIFLVSVASTALAEWVIWDPIFNLVGPSQFSWPPILLSAVILGIIWTIRSAFNLFLCSDDIPMSSGDYLVLKEIGNMDDRLTRWSLATLFAAGSFGFQDVPNTFWLPLIMGITAAVAAYDVALLGLALAAIGAVLWGISHLPISLAIVLGAGIIATALYFAIAQRGRE